MGLNEDSLISKKWDFIIGLIHIAVFHMASYPFVRFRLF